MQIRRLIGLFLLFGSFAFAQQYYTPAQRQIMARRAAIMDGYRLLAEAVQGVQITNSAKVKDFVGANDEIGVNLQQLVIRGAQISVTRYLPDNTCEIEMRLNSKEITNFLQITQNLYQFPQWKDVDFNAQVAKNEFVQVTGRGAPPLEISRQDVDSLRHENQGFRDQMAQLNARNQNLRNQMEQSHMSQEMFMKLSQANKDLQAEVHSLRQKHQDIQLQHQVLSSQKEQLQSEVTILREANQVLQMKLSQTQQTAEAAVSYRQQNNELTTQNQQSQKKLQDITALAQEFRQKYEAASQTQKQMMQQLEDLQKQQQNSAQKEQERQRLTTEWQKLQGQNQELQIKMQKMQALLAHYKIYQSKYEEGVKKVQELADKNKELLEQIQEKGQKVQSQNLELKELREQSGRLNNDANGVRQENAKLREQLVQETQNFTSEKKHYLAEMQQKLEEEKKRAQQIGTENARLLEQIKNLQGMMGDSNNRIAQLQEEITAYQTQPSGAWVSATPQQKLTARRTAILDGYRLLAEALQGVRLDAQTSIRDFVSERDEMNTAIEGFVRGAQIISTRCLPDGTCEIDMVIDLEQFIRFLQRMAQQYRAENWLRKLEESRFQPRSMLKVTGSGSLK
jgi:hypothetical protein